MKLLIIMALCALFAPFLAGAWQAVGSQLKKAWTQVREVPSRLRERFEAPCFANVAANPSVGRVHENSRTLLTDAAVTTRFLLCTDGTDANHAAATSAASDRPIGIFGDEASAAEDPIEVQSLNATNLTRKVVASEAITVGDLIYTAASGKVQDEPAVAGTYYRIGKAVTEAGADGDVIEVETHAPVKVVVIAALTSSDGTAAAAADLAALKVEAEKIGDDVRAIATALATPAEVKVLS